MIGQLARNFQFVTLFLVALALGASAAARAQWPGWRGDGSGLSAERQLPLSWGPVQNVRWKAAVEGEGSSSPIVWGETVLLTAALDDGTRRLLLCLDRQTGRIRWQREVCDENPEVASALTGHAASTPVTDGRRIVAAFGNAGVVCCDLQGRLVWHRRLGQFESELGLASSPVLHDGLVVLLCDHDGSRFRSFDSFLIALELDSGQTRWKTDRPGLQRSWSTPIIVPDGQHGRELVVSAQDELRGYDPDTGRQLWHVRGMSGWVAPSPVFAHGLIFAVSGRNGPILAVRPGGRGDVTQTHVAWRHESGGPYVCSPLVYGEHLFVHNEEGVLTCYDAHSGQMLARRRLGGRFMASGVLADDKLYLCDDGGKTWVIRPDRQMTVLAENPLGEETLASPAVAAGQLLLRSRRHLYLIARPPRDDDPPPAPASQTPPTEDAHRRSR